MPDLDLWRVTEPDRAFVVVCGSITLVLRHVESATPRILISLSTAEDDLLRSAVRIGKINGLLGLLHLAQETWIVVVHRCSQVGVLAHDEVISKINAVSFYCLSNAAYDASRFDPTTSHDPAATIELPYTSIAKILTNGQFYFSTADISTRLEVRVKRGANDAGLYDTRFLWNSYMLDSLLGFRARLTGAEREIWDRCQFLVMAIQGYCGVVSTQIGDSFRSDPAAVAVISRLGWHRAGTRFNARGIDDEGNVANFVETETILKAGNLCFSHVQIRGSIPLFWEQQGMQPFSTKLQLTRPQIASQPAFDLHFATLLETYPRLHIMNLLGTKDAEALLTTAYESHLRQLLATQETLVSKLEMSNFDFHARARTGGIETISDQIFREQRIADASNDFGYCIVGYNEEKDVFTDLLSFQHGIFRTNCLDCLDRTNVVQDILSRLALTHFLQNARPDWAGSASLWGLQRSLWAENGDALARIYAGTGALNTSFTRSGKRTLAGVFADASKSVNRMYQSNFADAGKQQAIDELLGNISGQEQVLVFDPLHDQVNEELKQRVDEYSTHANVTIWAGTFNLNGRPPGTENLLPWFFPDPTVEPDIFAIGFQEIVQLTAGQVIATDPEKKRRWEAYITQTLASRPDSKTSYVILRSEQLVGTALIIVVKTSIISSIRNVEAANKKTGLKGMAGNKGGIAIRLDYNDTSFCFVTAHFAAGSSNVDERDADFHTINSGLALRRGRSIAAHDNVIWIGDFNYRVSLPSENARSLSAAEDISTLLEADQLTLSMYERRTFSGYAEAPITFLPTYKYDVGTNDFDSSEKQRTPSWTDRVLFRGHSLDIQRYARAEIRLSDHRPVLAVFRAKINVIDKQKYDKLAEQLLSKLAANSPTMSTISSSLKGLNLPAPSDDLQSWWTDHEHPEGLVTDQSKWRNGNPFQPKPIIPRKPPVDALASA